MAFGFLRIFGDGSLATSSEHGDETLMKLDETFCDETVMKLIYVRAFRFLGSDETVMKQ